MDGVSGAFAVVSLTIQLAETIQKIKGFYREIRNVPKELLILIQDLDRLDGCFKCVRDLIEQQNSPLNASSSSLKLVESVLGDCKTIFQELETFVNKAGGSLVRRNHLQRAWGSLKIVLKKEDIQNLQNQLRKATETLHFAISINSAFQYSDQCSNKVETTEF